MICEKCNGEGSTKRRFGTIKKRRCLTCWGTGSLCRQQLRQADRLEDRNTSTAHARAVAATWVQFWTSGFNRVERRAALKAKRRRNDGHVKKVGVTLLELPKARS